MYVTSIQSGSTLEQAGVAAFWGLLTLLIYTYGGYALLLRLLPTRPVTLEPLSAVPFNPTVSILMAAHNEEAKLAAKLKNIASLIYPPGKLQVVVVSDGSTDRTAAILRDAATGKNPGRFEAILLPQAQGKAAALNRAAAAASGDILVFFDVRQSVDLDALEQLVAPFANSLVGAVSGELLLEASVGQPSSEALGIYWRIEKLVRKLESQTGSVVGATGAIYAMRRTLYVAIPAGTLLDDVLLPMYVARAGFRVLFQPAARARDLVFQEKGKEFSRKVRTLTGNYQLLRLAPWLLTPANPLLFRFISHKLLRLVAPFVLGTLLLLSALLPSTFYRASFSMQLVFYGLAACGALWPRSRSIKAVAIPNTFAMLNLAAVRALINFVGGHNTWK